MIDNQNFKSIDLITINNTNVDNNTVDYNSLYLKNKREQIESFYYLAIISITLFSLIIIFSIYMMYINYDEKDLISNFDFDLNPIDYKLLNS